MTRGGRRPKKTKMVAVLMRPTLLGSKTTANTNRAESKMELERNSWEP